MAELLAAIFGMVLAFALGRSFPRTIRVMESESETIDRIKVRIQGDIGELESELLSPNCGWSHGDNVRHAISICKRLLSMFPEEQSQ